MLTRAPGAVRPETTNWLGTVAPFAGRTFVISPTTAAEVPDVKFQPRLNCPPLASVPVTRTRCVPAWSGARGAYEKPRGERVDALVTSVSSRNTRIVFGSTTPPAKVASIVGRRDEMDAPRAGTSFASVIAPLLAPPFGAGVITWFGGACIAPPAVIATMLFAPRFSKTPRSGTKTRPARSVGAGFKLSVLPFSWTVTGPAAVAGTAISAARSAVAPSAERVRVVDDAIE